MDYISSVPKDMWLLKVALNLMCRFGDLDLGLAKHSPQARSDPLLPVTINRVLLDYRATPTCLVV